MHLRAEVARQECRQRRAEAIPVRVRRAPTAEQLVVVDAGELAHDRTFRQDLQPEEVVPADLVAFSTALGPGGCRQPGLDGCLERAMEDELARDVFESA